MILFFIPATPKRTFVETGCAHYRLITSTVAFSIENKDGRHVYDTLNHRSLTLIRSFRVFSFVHYRTLCMSCLHCSPHQCIQGISFRDHLHHTKCWRISMHHPSTCFYRARLFRQYSSYRLWCSLLVFLTS